jgi:hypothetical protein
MSPRSSKMALHWLNGTVCDFEGSGSLRFDPIISCRRKTGGVEACPTPAY